ncbi:hypothetical protein ACFVYA_26745 [Amycolatopsis sp. NPDC058278]|uniref:hypothetical protein n=1 Tax=Amycolatopsis sp. NPDC058278 TaxID=3346417 RepID=UPI0036DCF1DE
MPGWGVLAPVNLQTVVLRDEPPGTVPAAGEIQDGAALDTHTLAWVEEGNSSGIAFLTPSPLDGHRSVRVSWATGPNPGRDRRKWRGWPDRR